MKPKKQAPSGADILSQSREFEQPNERAERLNRIEQIEKLREITVRKPESMSPEVVEEYLQAYKGDLEVQDVSVKDKYKLINLKERAKQSSLSDDLDIKYTPKATSVQDMTSEPNAKTNSQPKPE